MFIIELIKRLHYPLATVKKTLLLTLQSLFEHHDKPKQFILDYNLYAIVKNLGRERQGLVLLNSISNSLLSSMIECIVSEEEEA